MSVVFLVQNEAQLRGGIEWCALFSESMDAPLRIAVLGENDVLQRHCEKSVRSMSPQVKRGDLQVETIPAEMDAIRDQCKSWAARLVVMVHTIDAKSWQPPLFESTSDRTIWLRPSGEPPMHSRQLCTSRSAKTELVNRFFAKLFRRLPRQFVSIEPVDQPLDLEPGGLLLVPIQNASNQRELYQSMMNMMNSESNFSVGVFCDRHKVFPGIWSAMRRWSDSVAPPLERTQRIALQQDLEEGSRPSWEFLLLISASSILAAFGLIQNSAAVIIGAMLIAPLMTPILGGGMALSIGNRPLMRRAFLSITLGFAGALVTSTLFGLVFRLFDNRDLSLVEQTEMWARCNPSVLDACVGLVGGMAAAYARTRSHLSSALAGAAIAAALVPPITTAGLQIAMGVWETNQRGTPILGPLMVVFVNILTILVGSSWILWMRGL
ncbi:MAG: DUF389 domain-containing protein, partial [Planctomycetota bacterium]